VDSLAAVRVLRELLTDEPVVASLGTPAFMLNAAGDRPLNFYMWAAMGVASPVALGLAIARPDRKVVILDGDGAALMGLNSLVTIGWRRQRNLLWIILQNGAFLETGGQDIAAGQTADIVRIARGAGMRHADSATDEATLRPLIERGLREDGPTLIVAVVNKDTIRALPPIDPIFVKDRFQAALA
jgi:phosphonopyruvate decarboxylase